MAKTITSFNVSWKADHEQYYRGHGVSYTDWTYCGTGCGETLREAFWDALEDLAHQGVDVSGGHLLLDSDLENEMLAELPKEYLDVDIVKAYCDAQGEHKTECQDCEGSALAIADEDPDCSICAGEWYYYVSVDIKVEGE